MTPRFERVTALGTLLKAIQRAARGKRHLPEVARFVMDAERHGLALSAALREPMGSESAWRPGPARTFQLYDPKLRQITVVPFADRVVHHALCEVLLPDFERFAIFHSYACRVGKGQHAALHCCQKCVRAQKDGWVFKGDIRAYFASIPHDRLIEVIHRRVGESDLRALLTQIVHAYPSGEGHGLPIGALTSQHLANLYLGVLDHYVKDALGARRYLRYMDDFAVFGTKEEVLMFRRHIAQFLHERLGLSLNERTSRVLPVRDGVPMLGMRVYPAVIRISRARWQQFQKRHRAVEQQLSDGILSGEQAAASLTSQYAHLQKWNTYRLRRGFLERNTQLAEARDHMGGS